LLVIARGRHHHADARIVHLTPAGEARITEAFAQHKNRMDRVAVSLTNAERATLIDLLKKFGVAADASLGAVRKGRTVRSRS
jgi:DNA-binding MarR family transcriptional regulator